MNALIIIVFAPVFAWLWLKLGARQPASPAKFAAGLIGVGSGFWCSFPAAQMAANRRQGRRLVAAHCLSHPHAGRALPQSCRFELDDQARARPDRRA